MKPPGARTLAFRRAAPAFPAHAGPRPVPSHVSFLISRKSRIRGRACPVRHQFGHRPDQRIDPVGRTAVRQAVRPEIAHLVFQLGEPSGMAHPALLVEHRHRLGAQPLSAPCPHRLHRHRRIDGADHRRHHVAALVDLGHQAIRLQLDGTAPPPRRPSPAACAARSVASASTTTCPSRIEPGRDDAAGIGRLVANSPAGRPPPRCGPAVRHASSARLLDHLRATTAHPRGPRSVRRPSSWRPRRVPP